MYFCVGFQDHWRCIRRHALFHRILGRNADPCENRLRDDSHCHRHAIFHRPNQHLPQVTAPRCLSFPPGQPGQEHNRPTAWRSKNFGGTPRGTTGRRSR